MQFVLTSKTESEQQPGKVQLQFRYLDPNAPQAPATNQPPAPMVSSYVNLSGTFDKVEADSYEIGATYNMTLEKV